MKKKPRNGRSASLVLAVLAAGLIGAPVSAPALALSLEQIRAKLETVIVFSVVNEQGTPLLAQPPAGEGGPAVSGVFILANDAQAFVDELKEKNPEVGNRVHVQPVPLADVYRLMRTYQDKGNNSVRFQFVPSKQEVESAVSLLLMNGQRVKGFDGTPLFVAKLAAGGFVTVKQNEKPMIPVFFERAELQQLIRKYMEQKPEVGATIQVQVLDLEGLLSTLQQSNDRTLEQLLLIQPKKTGEYVQALIKEEQEKAARAAAQKPPEQNAASP
jgi:nickel transport protein